MKLNLKTGIRDFLRMPVSSLFSMLFLANTVQWGVTACLAQELKKEDKREEQANSYRSDNAGRNTRDRNEYRKTADDQPFGGPNLKVLAGIRRKIVSNKSLSTYAKNVKILIENNKVTLRGPVRAAEEANWIVAAAKEIAPGYDIVDELEISIKR